MIAAAAEVPPVPPVVMPAKSTQQLGVALTAWHSQEKIVHTSGTNKRRSFGHEKNFFVPVRHKKRQFIVPVCQKIDPVCQKIHFFQNPHKKEKLTLSSNLSLC